MKYFFFLFFFLFFFHHVFSSCVNIDNLDIGLVKGIKKIKIPGYESTLNPSICVYKNQLVLTCRYISEKDKTISYIVFTKLDKDFNVIAKPQILNLRKDFPHIPSRTEDARLFVLKDKLFIIYNDNMTPKNTIHISLSLAEKRSMYIAEVIDENGVFQIKGKPCHLSYFNNRYYSEKNWVPFVYENTIYMVYQMNPHTILKLDNLYEKEQDTLKSKYTIMQANASTEMLNLNHYNWPLIRGGTPALLFDDYYLSFFHTGNKVNSSVAEDKYHYFMGAYLFEKKPPFSIKAISKHPIVGPLMYTSDKETEKKVIYPIGFLYDDSYFYVFCGKDDCEVILILLDRKKTLESLQFI